MQNSKKIAPQNGYIVKKVSITDTLRNIPSKQAVRFDCRVAGPMASAKAAASRLNTAAGREIYSITTDDNGATYIVSRSE